MNVSRELLSEGRALTDVELQAVAALRRTGPSGRVLAEIQHAKLFDADRTDSLSKDQVFALLYAASVVKLNLELRARLAEELH